MAYQTLVAQELHAVPDAHEVPVVGVEVEVKVPEFVATSKKRVMVSVVSGSVTDALTRTLDSFVVLPLGMVVVASSLSCVGEVGEVGVRFTVNVPLVEEEHVLSSSQTKAK